MPRPHTAQHGDRAQRLGEFLRYDTTLDPALSELAILVTAKFWRSHYEWFAHKGEALRAGIPPEALQAIANGERPDLPNPHARAVFDYAVELHTGHRVSDPVHNAALAALGERGVVELVGILGYYTLVAMTLNALEIGLPDGEHSDLVQRGAGIRSAGALTPILPEVRRRGRSSGVPCPACG